MVQYCDEVPHGITTVMLRNIPNRYTAEELLAELFFEGFKGSFDYLYLPVDFRTKCNRGFAFINFIASECARVFKQVFHNVRLTRYATRKRVLVSSAVRQGLRENVEHYVLERGHIGNPWFRPLIFDWGKYREEHSQLWGWRQNIEEKEYSVCTMVEPHRRWDEIEGNTPMQQSGKIEEVPMAKTLSHTIPVVPIAGQVSWADASDA